MNQPHIWIAIAATLITMTSAGCTGGGSAPVEPASPTPMPVTTVASSAPPPAPAPASPSPPAAGVAHNETYKPLLDAGVPDDTFHVDTPWQTLTLSVKATHTANCYVISPDPPNGTATGPAPSVTFRGPSGNVFQLALPTSNTCSSQSTGPVGSTVQVAPASEMGDWNIHFTGRGLNVELHVKAFGS